jgi:hypothetical protein
MAAKKHRETVALQDTAIVLQISMATMMLKNNCPAMPYKPAAMIDQLAAQMADHEANPTEAPATCWCRPRRGVA